MENINNEIILAMLKIVIKIGNTNKRTISGTNNNILVTGTNE